MTREEIIKYIEFRASGINQAINYDYKEFYKEMLEMCKQEKQVKQNDFLHSVSGSYLPKCNRVEVIDKSGRAYTNYYCKSAETQMQDGERTLKVFIS